MSNAEGGDRPEVGEELLSILQPPAGRPGYCAHWGKNFHYAIDTILLTGNILELQRGRRQFGQMQMLKVSLRPSWTLAALLTAAHGAAITVIALVSMPPGLQLILIAVLAGSLTLEIRRAVLLRAPDAVVAIEIAFDDTLRVQTRRGDWIKCKVLGSTYVTHFLAIVNLKERGGGKTRRAVILPDSIDAEDFRKLRVWLRWNEERQPA